MADWWTWIRKMIWQPRRDDRVDFVVGEVNALRDDMVKVKEQVAALEAFQRLAQDAER